jgi:hypothetical protein
MSGYQVYHLWQLKKNILNDMARDPTFVESFMDKFFEKKDQKIELIYKKI